MTTIDIVKYLYRTFTRPGPESPAPELEAVMSPYPYLVFHVQEQRAREIHEARLARIAVCVRACQSAPTTLVGRLVRVLRPAPTTC